MFQSSHGTASDIACWGIANPVAVILSVTMLLGWVADQRGDADCRVAAAAIAVAVGAVPASMPRTRDLGGGAGTQELPYAILAALPA